MKMNGVESIGVGFCPASLCRLLRGIASAGAPGQGRIPPPTTAPPHSSHSFTIAAILGLKGHEGYEDIPSATQSQGVPGNSRGRPRTMQGHQQNNNTQIQNNNNNNNNNHHHHHGSKSKRVRTIFTPEQLERLEAEFERQQYMVGPERLYLAHALQLTEAQVKVWFQNRRIKWRKQHLELTQQRLAMARRQQLADQLDASSSSSLPEHS